MRNWIFPPPNPHQTQWRGGLYGRQLWVLIQNIYAVLWIKNDLFRILIRIWIQIRILTILLRHIWKFKTNNQREDSTNYLPISISHFKKIFPNNLKDAGTVLLHIVYNLSALSFLLDPDPKQIIPDPGPTGSKFTTLNTGLLHIVPVFCSLYHIQHYTMCV